MFYTLPPDTSNLPVAGTLTISIKLIYIDIPISTINYGLRFWGYSKPIIIDP